jgi:hypothetical protein
MASPEPSKRLAKLEDLPLEILLDICSHLSSAQSFRSLSLCNKKLHGFIKAQGWRDFARTQFPSLSTGISPFEVDAAEVSRSLTALSRSWDRRAVLATRLHPTTDDPHFGREDQHESPRRPWAQWRPRFRFRQRGQQTIGFQPVIASQEEVLDSGWTRRREFVVWGAGAQIGIRLKQTGMRTESRTREEELDKVDQHGNVTKWNTHQPEASRDGADDITALKLLSRDYISLNNQTPRNKVYTVTGTAAGKLSLSKLEFRPGQQALLRKEFIYRTGRVSSVRSLDISPSEELIASAYSNGLLMLHFVYDRDRKGFPISSISVPQATYGHVWATHFVSDVMLAVGTGRSYQPLHIYGITPGGLSENPIRSWTVTDDESTSEVFGSVGCIHRLPEAPGLSSEIMFLSGHTDGAVRLHDMRSPHSHDAIFSDPVDDGAVFSLVTKGRERLVAGNSRNSLIKMFDLRMTGSRVYSYRNAAIPQDSTHLCSGAGEAVDGWSMFLHPGESSSLSNSNSRGHARRSSLTSGISDARASASPVYSLSSPSAYSPSIFAGLEAQVTQIDMVDVFDKYPDPVFDSHHSKTIGSKWFWDPNASSKNLAYYEHTQSNRLRKQVVDWPTNVSSLIDKGYDYRWSEMVNESA